MRFPFGGIHLDNPAATRIGAWGQRMKTIGICAQSFSPGWKAMFGTLGEALGVSFEERTFGDDQNIDGWVLLAADRKLASGIGRAKRPCYVVLDGAELISCGTSSKITFANRAELAAVLRGRDVMADDAVVAKALPQWLSDVEPLAFKDGSAVWAIQEQGDCRHHYVALPPPELNDGEPLFTHFSGQRIACLLPLVLFVRSLAEDQCWELPPLQAAFMFDDPNLHWTSYGFIDYGEMVRHAVAGHYHVSMATIPLDAWFVHPPTSAIFKEEHRPDILAVSRERPRVQGAGPVAVGRSHAAPSPPGSRPHRQDGGPHGARSCAGDGPAARGVQRDGPLRNGTPWLRGRVRVPRVVTSSQ